MWPQIGPGDPIIGFIDHYDGVIRANVSLIKDEGGLIGAGPLVGRFF